MPGKMSSCIGFACFCLHTWKDENILLEGANCFLCLKFCLI